MSAPGGDCYRCRAHLVVVCCVLVLALAQGVVAGEACHFLDLSCKRRVACEAKENYVWAVKDHHVSTTCECTREMVRAGLCTSRGATVVNVTGGACPAKPIMGCTKTKGRYIAEQRSYNRTLRQILEESDVSPAR